MKEKLLIYLVDDDVDDRLFFEDAINEISIPVNLVSFSNGVDLMAYLLDKDLRPNIVFIDLNMPLMNGKECIVDIKKEKQLNAIPLVIYSTTCDENDLEQLKSLGASHFMQKPNTFRNLVGKLEIVISGLTSDRTEPLRKTEFFIP